MKNKNAQKDKAFADDLEKWIDQVLKDSINFSLSRREQFQNIAYWARGYGNGESESKSKSKKKAR